MDLEWSSRVHFRPPSFQTPSSCGLATGNKVPHSGNLWGTQQSDSHRANIYLLSSGYVTTALGWISPVKGYVHFKNVWALMGVMETACLADSVILATRWSDGYSHLSHNYPRWKYSFKELVYTTCIESLWTLCLSLKSIGYIQFFIIFSICHQTIVVPQLCMCVF